MNEINDILARLDALERKTNIMSLIHEAPVISHLQDAALTANGEIKALQLVVMALIACHSAPENVRAAFQTISSGSIDSIQESGFENKTDPVPLQRLLSEIEKAVQNWNQRLSIEAE